MCLNQFEPMPNSIMNGISHIAALNGLPVPPQNPPDTDAISYKLAADYMKFKLSTVGYVWPNGIETPDDMECAQAKKDMRALGAEFEQRYADVFDNMVESLQITPNSLFPTFMGVTDELFADGIRWGRIVGLYAFAGNLAVECMHHNMPHMVASLIHWVSHYVETRLADWIAENEGWDGFVAFYERGTNERRSWGTLKRLITGVGVAAGALGVVTLGAMLAGR